MTDPVVKKVIVNCNPDRAFDVFVNQITTWWPLDRHAASAASGKAALALTVEPQVGGAVYETMYDKTRNDWGKVLEFEPGEKFAMTWHPGSNADKPTRVDVAFAATGNGQAEVTLTHSGWEIWGDEAQAMRDGYNSGWDSVLDAYSVCTTAG